MRKNRKRLRRLALPYLALCLSRVFRRLSGLHPAIGCHFTGCTYDLYTVDDCTRLPHELFNKRKQNIMDENKEQLGEMLKHKPGLIYEEE